jgi:hypothetical protein
MSDKAFEKYVDDFLLRDQDFEPIKTIKSPKKVNKESRDAGSPIKPYRQRSPNNGKAMAKKRSPHRKLFKEKQKSFNDDINHIFLSPENKPNKEGSKESPQSN